MLLQELKIVPKAAIPNVKLVIQVDAFLARTLFIIENFLGYYVSVEMV
jgi:hypothetical protein